MYPQIKKSKGVRSGVRAGQLIGPLFPIHFVGNLASKCSFTISALWYGVPSC